MENRQPEHFRLRFRRSTKPLERSGDRCDQRRQLARANGIVRHVSRHDTARERCNIQVRLLI